MRIREDIVLRTLYYALAGVFGLLIVGSVAPSYAVSGFFWGMLALWILQQSVRIERTTNGNEIVIESPWSESQNDDAN